MKKLLFGFLPVLISLLLFSCSTVEKEFDRESIEKDEEFEQVVKIEKIEEPVAEQAPEPEKPSNSSQKKTTPKTKEKKTSSKKNIKDGQKKSPEKKSVKTKENLKTGSKKQTAKKEPRQPPLEDSEGFDGRRPIVQPYNVGEEIVLGVSFFAVEAGKFTMKVMPMVQVNGKKSYHFKYLIKTSPLFSMFYRADDVAETFVDYETLLPSSYEIHVDESKQVRETRTFFDQEKRKATYWDRRQRKGKKLEKKKKEWDLLPFSQNVFSAAYYLRNFTLKVGKHLKVNVGHEGKNIIMTAKVIRKETLYTDVGKFETFVVKPKFDVDGKFKPTGENYLWLTADKNKYIVRVESKVRIGSIVAEVQKIKK